VSLSAAAATTTCFTVVVSCSFSLNILQQYTIVSAALYHRLSFLSTFASCAHLLYVIVV
jgi:hypothetical protein